MRIVCTEQRTQEWFAAKLGKPSASQVWRALSTLKIKSKNGEKGEPSGDQIAYKKELAQEILGGVPVDHWVSKEMDEGSALEPLARAEYISRNNLQEWNETGFILHPTMDRFGCSPDLLTTTSSRGGRNGAEFKCPKANTHLGYVDAFIDAQQNGLCDNSFAYAVIPEPYIYQCQACICICNSDKWDWVSFYPPEPEDSNLLPDRPGAKRANLPESMRYLEIPVYRDDVMIAKIEDGIKAFNARLLEYVERMRLFHGRKTLAPYPMKVKE